MCDGCRKEAFGLMQGLTRTMRGRKMAFHRWASSIQFFSQLIIRLTVLFKSTDHKNFVFWKKVACLWAYIVIDIGCVFRTDTRVTSKKCRYSRFCTNTHKLVRAILCKTDRNLLRDSSLFWTKNLGGAFACLSLNSPAFCEGRKLSNCANRLWDLVSPVTFAMGL